MPAFPTFSACPYRLQSGCSLQGFCSLLFQDGSIKAFSSSLLSQPKVFTFKTFACWDRQGRIVSMGPDRLLYIINVGNRFFTRPRRLLRPVVLDDPSPPPPTVLAQVSPLLLRHSQPLQSCAASTTNQIKVLSPACSVSTPTSSWEHGNLPLMRWNAETARTLKRPGLLPAPPLLLPPHPSSLKTTQTCPSPTISQTSQTTWPSINPTTGSVLSISTGPRSPPDFLPSSLLCLWPWSSLPDAAISRDVDSVNPARHTKVLRSIVAGATHNVTTHQLTQSGAYSGSSSPETTQAPSASGGSFVHPQLRVCNLTLSKY